MLKKKRKAWRMFYSKSFDLLNEDVDIEMTKKTILAQNEKMIKMKSDLHNVEEVISKEVKDIKKL